MNQGGSHGGYIEPTCFAYVETYDGGSKLEQSLRTIGPTEVDHRTVSAPYLRIVEQRAEGTVLLTQWDFRVTQPNVKRMSTATAHSLEHCLGIFLREETQSVLNVGPMGCLTGFYITTIGMDGYDSMANALDRALRVTTTIESVPLANDRQCGWAGDHSAEAAARIAADLLAFRAEWHQVTAE
ncbi:S-ribosylhomocysteine lyase [Streptomyces sp. NPDC088270]|uniref:S-ribosylhomocysteine lyase n=1 Tax=Streptomyces sp. NPDC088270 TaxID=3160990 RepID=UPI00343B183D